MEGLICASMRSPLLAPLLFSLILAPGRGVSGEEVDRRPNFVLMIADDLGIGDVGCYDNDTVRTPNIDRLASEGVKLTQHIAAAPLCTPSRAAFMTGRYAVRSGMAGTGRVQVLVFLAGSGGLPPSETTFAKRLQQQGYTTGLVGKWHLGVNCERRGDHCHHPNQHGFSYYYGLPFTLFGACVPRLGMGDILTDMEHTLRNLTIILGVGLFTLVLVRVRGLFEVRWWLLVGLLFLSILATALWYVPFKLLPTWNCIIMRNQEVIEQPMTVETLPQRLLGEAQNFIKRNANRPFLLFFSLAHIHTPLFETPAFVGKGHHGLYSDNQCRCTQHSKPDDLGESSLETMASALLWDLSVLWLWQSFDQILRETGGIKSEWTMFSTSIADTAAQSCGRQVSGACRIYKNVLLHKNTILVKLE